MHSCLFFFSFIQYIFWKNLMIRTHISPLFHLMYKSLTHLEKNIDLIVLFKSKLSFSKIGKVITFEISEKLSVVSVHHRLYEKYSCYPWRTVIFLDLVYNQTKKWKNSRMVNLSMLASIGNAFAYTILMYKRRCFYFKI